MTRLNGFDDALKKLHIRFGQMEFPIDSRISILKGDVLYKWPGKPDEDVMVCAPFSKSASRSTVMIFSILILR